MVAAPQSPQARRDQLVRDLATPGKLMPPLTLNEAALVLGCSRWTVARKIDRRELRKERGRIPAALLRPLLS